MAEELAGGTPESGGGGMDIDAVAESLGREIGLTDESSDAGPATPLPASEKDGGADLSSGTTDKAAEKPAAPEKQAAAPEKPAAKPVPKSWPKEAHPLWEKLDPATQEMVEKRENDFHQGIEAYKGDAAFARSVKEVIAPYQPLLDAQGIKDPTEGIRGLLNAHYQLSSSDEGQRTAYMAKLLKSYRIDPAKLATAVGDTTTLTDPALQPLYDQINNLTTQMTAAQTAQAEAKRAEVQREVDAFASDPAHPYFEEVAQHIVLLLRDPQMDLKSAYEQAVRANPVTWAKEEARLRSEIAADLKRQADEAAAKAKKAIGTTVRGRPTERSPAEAIGTMEDTMRETLAAIHNRTS